MADKECKPCTCVTDVMELQKNLKDASYLARTLDIRGAKNQMEEAKTSISIISDDCKMDTSSEKKLVERGIGELEEKDIVGAVDTLRAIHDSVVNKLKTCAVAEEEKPIIIEPAEEIPKEVKPPEEPVEKPPEKCPHGILKPEIKVDDDFAVHTSLSNSLKRTMDYTCPIGAEGNKCIADMVMRFKRILKKNKNCLTESPKVQWTEKAKQQWKRNEEALSEAKKEFEERMREWEKDPFLRKPSRPVGMLTPTQQKNIKIIKGEEALM